MLLFFVEGCKAVPIKNEYTIKPGSIDVDACAEL